MKEDLHEIDKLFKKAIDDHEEIPSPAVWDSIENDLDKNKFVNINRKYIQLQRIAIALLILLLGAGAYTVYTWKTLKEQAKIIRTKNNIQTRADAVLAQSRINAEVLNNNKNETGIPKEQVYKEENKKVSVAPGVIEDNASVNSGGDNVKRISDFLGSKKIVGKGNQKIVINDADYEQEKNEGINIAQERNDKEIKEVVDFTAMQAIKQEILKPEPAKAIKKIGVEISRFPDYLTTLVPKKMKGKIPAFFTATAFYSPNISVNHFKDDDLKVQRGQNDDDRDQIKHGERFQFSRTVGMLLDYNMNRHWSLQSGVSISNKTIHIDPKTIYAGLDNSGTVKYLYSFSSGYLFLSPASVINPVVGDSVQAFEATNFLQYVSVPLVMKYNFSVKKMDLFLSTGISVNILTKNKIATGIKNGTEKEISISNKINGLQNRYFGVSIGMGASYNISGKMALSFIPSYNFAITSLTKGAAVKTYPDTIGFGVGVSYKL